MAIVEAGGFREEEGAFGDIPLWMRMALGWDFGYIATPLVGFRIHPNRVTSELAAQHGVTSEGRERVRLFSQIIFERRMDFLEDAPLEPRRTRWLRALATLQLLIQSAAWVCPGARRRSVWRSSSGRSRESCCGPRSGASW